ncbi:MAG: PilZ domain-containing protein [Pseudomonadota bacterium]
MAILHTMWQRISGKTTNAEPTQPEPAFTALQKALLSLHPEQAEQPNQYLPLQQLHAQRQIIEVKINGSSQSYQTFILAIDIERGLLWLDDLFPNQRLLKAGDTITLRHHRNSEQLCFSSPVVAWGNSFGANGLAILLPEHLSYQPRRQHHRCDLSGDASLSVKIRPVGYEPSYGNIQDLSLGGSALRVAGNLTGQLRHGALLPVCELHLSDDLLIRCSARIRAFSIARSPRRSTLISVEFIDLTAESRHQLQQFLYKTAHSEQIRSQQLELDEQSELILRTA